MNVEETLYVYQSKCLLTFHGLLNEFRLNLSRPSSALGHRYLEYTQHTHIHIHIDTRT